MKPIGPIPSYGREVAYRGIRMRSICEGLWAAAFDVGRIEWEYEPFGEQTAPDFRFGKDSLLECKGAVASGVWTSHPDAAKARNTLVKFFRTNSLAIGFSNGVLFMPDPRLDSAHLLKDPKSWRAAPFEWLDRWVWEKAMMMLQNANRELIFGGDPRFSFSVSGGEFDSTFLQSRGRRTL